MSGLAMVLIGGTPIAYGLTVVWGLFFGESGFVHRRRAAYEAPMWEFTPFGPDRILVVLPFAGVAALAVGIASFIPRESLDVAQALVVAAAAAMAIGMIGFLVPGPFTRPWMKDAEARRRTARRVDIEVPPDSVDRMPFGDADSAGR